MTQSDQISTRFNATQYEFAYPDGTEHHYWTNARAQIVVQRLKLLGGATQVGNILDIGCGRGTIVAYLRHLGCTAFGCDPDRSCPLNHEVEPYLYLGTEAFSLPAELRQQITLITLLDVLEHIEDPASFLSKCAIHFPHCRYILATLPARQELWSNYDEYYGHHRRYDREGARKLTAGGEFRILHQGYFFHLLYPAAWALKLMRKERDVIVHAPGQKSQWLHRLLATFFRWEYKLLPASVLGTSLLVLLIRQE